MKKVLLVEDDSFLVRMCKAKMEDAGFAVSFLEDGDRVVVTAREQRPDLILLDLLLPGKDGYAVLAELKGEPETAKIPVLVLSQLHLDEEMDKSRNLGAVDHIAKQKVTFDEVVERVKVLLG